MAEKNKSIHKKKFKPDKKFWVRLICGFLALLMVLSVATILIQFFAYGLYAADNTAKGGFVMTEDGTQPIISVGLMYADGVTVGFETSAEYGLKIGYTGENRLFERLWETDVTKVSVVCDSNLSKKNMTYSLTASSDAAVGGWHIQLRADSSNVPALLNSVANTFPSVDIFPAYADRTWYVRAGQFTSEANAQSMCAQFSALGYTASTVAPTKTALTVIDPSNDDILFEYDGGTNTALALAPIQTDGDISYLVTPAKNTYDGFFMYKRWITNSSNGVAVTNILPLEDYIKGVLPWEVSSKSSQNLLRTFAIAARSYALSMRKHQTFDVCNGTCCQMYKGLNRTNENVIEAVEMTDGTVLAYNGEIVCSTYSSSTGGTTVAAAEAWGSSSTKYPYLTAVITPWEDYKNCYNGSWTVSLTSSQIISRLNSAGYTGLSGSIADISIGELSDGSTYVYSLIVTDSSGNTVTIRRSDNVRSALGLSSANFVVGRAGETLTVTDYTYNGEIADAIAAIRAGQGGNGDNGGGKDDGETDDEKKSRVYVLNGNSDAPQHFAVVESVILTSGDGVELNTNPRQLSVLSGTGMSVIDIIDVPLISDDGIDITPIEPNLLPDLNAPDAIVATTREVAAEGDAGSFVFVGRGWGHGVGLSQYGVRDLAALGYDYETILSLYLPGTYLVKASDIIK